MFKRCLLGSVLLHIIVISGIGVCVPASSIDPEKIAYFQLITDVTGNGEPARQSNFKTATRDGTRLIALKPDTASGRELFPPSPKTKALMVAVERTAETGKAADEIDQPVSTPGNANDSGQSGIPGTIPGIPGKLSADSGLSSGGISGISGGESGISGTGISLVPPHRIYAPKPDYPAIAKMNNWQGITILRALIKINGAVGEITVFQTSGYHILDQSAITAVKKWRYQPGMRQGISVAWYLRIPVRFNLGE